MKKDPGSVGVDRQILGWLAVGLAGLVVLLGLGNVVPPDRVLADAGDCEDADITSWDAPGGDDLNIPSNELGEGQVWESVCIKAGQPHSSELTQNGYYDLDHNFEGTEEPSQDGCYFLVSGLGSDGNLSVELVRIGGMASDPCAGRGLSHIDANVDGEETPPPEGGEESPTPEDGVESPTPATQEEARPTGSAEVVGIRPPSTGTGGLASH